MVCIFVNTFYDIKRVTLNTGQKVWLSDFKLGIGIPYMKRNCHFITCLEL